LADLAKKFGQELATLDFTGTGAVTGCSSGSDGSGSDCSDSKLDDEDGLIFKKCNAFS
jgi:hypothetical protein